MGGGGVNSFCGLFINQIKRL